MLLVHYRVFWKRAGTRTWGKNFFKCFQQFSKFQPKMIFTEFDRVHFCLFPCSWKWCLRPSRSLQGSDDLRALPEVVGRSGSWSSTGWVSVKRSGSMKLKSVKMLESMNLEVESRRDSFERKRDDFVIAQTWNKKKNGNLFLNKKFFLLTKDSFCDFNLNPLPALKL